MKSRLAVLSMLVLGLLFSTTGAGLAITGFTSNDSASVAQYGGDDGADNGGVEGESEGGNGGGNGGGGSPTVGAGDDTVVQPTRQVEAGATGGGGDLPFTGYAAIPVLLGGVALLSAGLIVRRRSSDS